MERTFPGVRSADRTWPVVTSLAVALAGGSLASCSDADPLTPPDAAFIFGDGGPAAPDSGEPADATESTDAIATDVATDSGLADAAPPADAGFIDAGTICDEQPAVILSATDVASMAGTLDGQSVTIVGTATTGPELCTTVACPVDNPCCNTCQAPLLVGAATLIASDCVSTVACSGTECGLVCPFVTGFQARFRGVLRAGPPITLELLGVD